MGFNPGTGPASSGGDDEQAWRDLVARLEQPQDAFMDDAGTSAAATGERPGAGGGEAAGNPKGVADFDPLGVWQQHLAPAPSELSAKERATPAAGDAGPRDYAGLEDEGFVPEEPPSLSTAEPAILLSWLGAAGAPLFLVFAAIFWRSIPLTITIGVIMAFIGGTGYLLSRLPNHRDHDGGDGAVV